MNVELKKCQERLTPCNSLNKFVMEDQNNYEETIKKLSE